MQATKLQTELVFCLSKPRIVGQAMVRSRADEVLFWRVRNVFRSRPDRVQIACSGRPRSDSEFRPCSDRVFRPCSHRVFRPHSHLNTGLNYLHTEHCHLNAKQWSGPTLHREALTELPAQRSATELPSGTNSLCLPLCRGLCRDLFSNRLCRYYA